MDSLPPQPMILPFKAGLIISALMFVLCVVNTLARTSCVAVSDAKLKQLAEDGTNKAIRLQKLLERNASGSMDSLEFCSVLFLLVLTAFSEYIMYVLLEAAASRLGLFDFANGGLHIASAVLGAVIICLLYTIFAVTAPRRIASKYSEGLALALSGYICFVTCVARPILWFIEFAARIVSAIFRVKNEDIGEEVTEEEIRMMVDIGSESGAIDDDEKQMIHNIFEMDDKPVEEIMTHRTEACVLWIEDSIEDWRKFIDDTKHTRYPVCGESIDDVIGIVTSREFYRFLLGGGKDVHSIMREAFFIPDTVKADELLSIMQRENEHMGVVMDEYGGFQGIVTQEDLIEEIVGELYSEYDEPEAEENDIEKIDEETWSIDGSAEIEDVEEALGIKISDGDFNTFAGLVLRELQTIPADGEVFEIEADHMHIKVTSVVDHRIEKALVSVISEEDLAETDKAEEDTEGE